MTNQCACGKPEQMGDHGKTICDLGIDPYWLNHRRVHGVDMTKTSDSPTDAMIADALRKFMDMHGATIGLVWKGWIETAIERLSVEPSHDPNEGHAEDCGVWFCTCGYSENRGEDHGSD